VQRPACGTWRILHTDERRPLHTSNDARTPYPTCTGSPQRSILHKPHRLGNREAPRKPTGVTGDPGADSWPAAHSW